MRPPAILFLTLVLNTARQSLTSASPEIFMEPFRSDTHSFIVKIWLEENDDKVGQITWRGHITHVPSGARRYLNDLGGILAFIAPYLTQMGVKIDKCWQAEMWLRRLKLRLWGHSSQSALSSPENKQRDLSDRANQQ